MTLTELLFESAPEILVRKMIEAEASDEPLNVNLPDRVPLMMVYWTVAAADDGNVRFTPDIYGRDSRLLDLLVQP